jgi:hypothetical protein
MGEGYNWHLYACRLFCDYEMPTSFLVPLPGKPVNSICRVNMIQVVNTISLCRIIFCSILFVVLIEMCWNEFDHSAI